MTKASIRRIFEVDAPLEEAWHRLAEVERWPEWAPHIVSVSVSPPGELGPTSAGAFKIKRLGRTTFRMSAWDPSLRWEWVGGFPGVRISYDHRFEASGPVATRLELVGRAPRSARAGRSTRLRSRLRSQRRPSDPASAGVVPTAGDRCQSDSGSGDAVSCRAGGFGSDR